MTEDQPGLVLVPVLLGLVAAVVAWFGVIAVVRHLWLAILPVALFVGIYLWRKSLAAIFAAAGWTMFGVWEALLDLQILCDAECNIRIDLALVLPVLTVLSAVAVGVALFELARWSVEERANQNDPGSRRK